MAKQLIAMVRANSGVDNIQKWMEAIVGHPLSPEGRKELEEIFALAKAEKEAHSP